jgi:anti-sigma-K factor RskA
MQPEEREMLAGELVLGTLGADEYREAKALLASDPVFAAAVAQWEVRLAPLAAAVPPVEPPAHLRARILHAIGAGAEIIRLRRQIRLWRVAAAAGGALAAGLAALVIWLAQPLPQERYVAVLQPDGQGPAFIASVDVAAGTISVRRVQAETPQGKSFELWAVGGGRDRPQSLGIIDTAVRSDVRLSPDTVLAISLEPAGGSPTGQPTGPVLYTGQLVPAE